MGLGSALFVVDRSIRNEPGHMSFFFCLTFCILMDCSIHIDTISMELSIV